MNKPPWSGHPIYRLPDQFMAAYDRIEDRDNGMRLMTSRAHKDLVGLWIIALGLLADAFASGRVYSFTGDPDDEIGVKAFNLRWQLLGLAGRGSKPSLDLLLAGYYTEAFGVIRSMLDGWARVLYVRLRPKEYGRWYEPENEAGQAETKAPPHFGEIDGVVTADGNADDRRLFDEANLRFRLLSAGSHPSGEGITQTRDYERGLMVFDPDYREDFARHGFNHGLFAHIALLDEIEIAGAQDDGWRSRLAALNHYWQPLRASFDPVLAEEAKALAEEQAARSEAKRATRVSARAATPVTT